MTLHLTARRDLTPEICEFTLTGDAPLLLIAGGIGITPMLSMLRRRRRLGLPVRLIYLTHSAGQTAFHDLLTTALSPPMSPCTTAIAASPLTCGPIWPPLTPATSPFAAPHP